MTMQEMSTAVQHDLPIKIFVINNQYMGMVRQWQELLHWRPLRDILYRALPISSSLPRPITRSASAASAGDLDGAIRGDDR
jgi:acetolactate synthase-1/2/3 large subunit